MQVLETKLCFMQVVLGRIHLQEGLGPREEVLSQQMKETDRI